MLCAVDQVACVADDKSRHFARWAQRLAELGCAYGELRLTMSCLVVAVQLVYYVGAWRMTNSGVLLAVHSCWHSLAVAHVGGTWLLGG